MARQKIREKIHYSVDEDVALVHLDDGKANAMQIAWCEEMNAALDRVEKEPVRAVVVHGRDRFFSGGLDLKVLPALPPLALRQTTDQFMATMKRLFLFPKPVVAAAAGHAIAGGMMLYLAADMRLALDDEDALFGLNEATTGIPLLGGTAGICQYAIPPRHHNELILHGRMLDAATTRARGITDELVGDAAELLPRAMARARELSDLDLATYAINKRILREPAWNEAVRAAAGLADEVPTENLFQRIRR